MGLNGWADKLGSGPVHSKGENSKMKKVIALALALLSIPAFAKTKTYDQAGKVTFESYGSNAEAHTSANGQPVDVYCNVDEHSADCRDHAGVFYVTLADGRKATFFLDLSMYKGTGNPLLDAVHTHAVGKGDGSFQYREQSLRGLDGKETGICVPSDTAKSPWGHEACYFIVPVAHD